MAGYNSFLPHPFQLLIHIVFLLELHIMHLMCEHRTSEDELHFAAHVTRLYLIIL
jgi:hypothetical protein